jgi:phospholipid/cholesterol/gamma-HCH transport system substrate-binding protein
VKLSKEVKVGLVTVIAIGCFLYGFSFLKGKNLFSNQRKFYAVYSNIDGLVEANPLMINGFRVGMVGNITLAKDTSKKVIVTLILNDEVDIPVNSIAKVISSDILGSKAVELQIGNSLQFAKKR